MTNKEFSDGFTTMLNSYNTIADFNQQSSPNEIVLDEYEKSLFLTKAQEELVMRLYDGKNRSGDSFELTEEDRRLLESIVKTKEYTKNADALDPGTEGLIPLSGNSTFFKLPTDIGFITIEQIIYDDSTVKCLTDKGFRASVKPTTQDEYNKIKDNPFKGITKYKTLRMDYGNQIVEIISKYNIGKYIIKYVKKPRPIILENLPNGLSIDGVSTASTCELNSMLHRSILERAVTLALSIKSIQSNKNGK